MKFDPVAAHYAASRFGDPAPAGCVDPLVHASRSGSAELASRRFEKISIGPDRHRPDLGILALVFEQQVMSQEIRLTPADLRELKRVVDAEVAELDG